MQIPSRVKPAAGSVLVDDRSWFEPNMVRALAEPEINNSAGNKILYNFILALLPRNKVLISKLCVIFTHQCENVRQMKLCDPLSVAAQYLVLMTGFQLNTKG